MERLAPSDSAVTTLTKGGEIEWIDIDERELIARP
jgi:hypothetical protein